MSWMCGPGSFGPSSSGAKTPSDADVPDLLGGLQQQVAEHISHHANTLGAIVNPQGAAGWPRDVGSFVPDAINTKRDQVITKYQNEARLYTRAVTQHAASAGGVTVHGNVGSILTGAYAVANIHIDTVTTPRLLGALAALTTAIQGAQDISVDARAQSLEIAEGLQSAAKAAKPNGPMLTALLSGLSTTVQTVASLKPA